MQRALHPNLARVASQYDSVMLEYTAGRLSETEAYQRIELLTATDDSGVRWSIAPTTGEWRYMDTWGGYYYAEPPAYGVVGQTPFDYGSGSVTHPRVSLYVVDSSASSPLGSSKASRLRARYFKTISMILVGLALCFAALIAVILL